MSSKTLIVMLIVLLGLAAGLQAKPPAHKLEPIRGQLDKKIRINLMETPLERALDYLEKQSGIAMIVDRNTLEGSLRIPISLESDSITVEDALNWVCSLGQVDYDVRDEETLYVSTRSNIIQPYLEVRTYDVRVLSQRVIDFPAPSIELVSGEADISISSFDDGGVDLIGLGGGIVDLIKDSIRDDQWDIYGVGIEISGGMLIATCTADVHEQIKELLTAYQSAYGKMVAFDVRYLLVETDMVNTLIGKNRSQCILDAEAMLNAQKMLKKHADEITLIGGGRTVCFNTQRVSIAASNTRSYIRDLTPVVADLQGGVDPEIDTVSEGAVFDVRPTVSFDNAWITVDIKSVVCASDPIKGEAFSAPVSGFQGQLLVEGIESVEDKEGITHEFGTLNGATPKVGAAPAGGQTLQIDFPEVDIVKVKTTVRTPDKGGVLMSGMTSAFSKLAAAAGREVVVLIKTEIVR